MAHAKKSNKEPQCDPVETEKAWDNWVWFLKASKFGGIVTVFALLVLVAVYMAGK